MDPREIDALAELDPERFSPIGSALFRIPTLREGLTKKLFKPTLAQIGDGLDTGPNRLPSYIGEEVFPRWSVNGTVGRTLGTMDLMYVKSRADLSVSKIRFRVTTGSSPGTLSKVGLYAISTAGDGLLVSGSSNDTNIFATSNTDKTITIPSTTLVPGRRYAIAFLNVGGVAGSVAAVSIQTVPFNDASIAQETRIMGRLTGQTDLPGTFLGSSLTAGLATFIPWAAVTI